MKKVVIFLLLSCSVSALVFSGTEEIDVYRYLYRNAIKNVDKLDILQNMAEAKLTGAGEFYAWALRELVLKYPSISGADASTEKAAANDQAMILAALIGAEKYTPAAADLWLVAESFSDPLAKAEALMALGRIRATGYLPHVVRVLDNLNPVPTPDRLYGERIAFGAIIALEKYQDLSGYLPVFIASVSWYTQRVRTQATKSLPFIAKDRDPSSSMLNLMKSSAYDNSIKKLGLDFIEKITTASNKGKAEIAVAALAEGHKAAGNNPQQRGVSAEMRKQALDMIRKYKSNDPAIYLLMRRSYTIRDADTSEKIAAINAIAAQKTDEAAEMLSEFLIALKPPLTQDQDQIIRALIPALGRTERPSARLALTQVTKQDYTPAIKKQATDAINQIPN